MFHKIFIILLIIVSIASNNCQANKASRYDWLDLNRTTSQLIESRNFKSETHFITTSDGYILQIFRIINPYLKNKNRPLKPIIIQHGFLGNSEEYLIARKGYLSKSGKYIEDGHIITDCKHKKKLGKTLAFVLSACGYDVWLSNIRGNKYTTNHTSLDPKDYHFWKFSLDELSQIDLPAVINYIGVRTKDKRIGYIGYSMGTTIMFALMSAQPQYSSIIDPFIAIAPVVYVSKIPKLFQPFRYLYPAFRAIPSRIIRFEFIRDFLVDFFGQHELPGRDPFTSKMGAHLLDQSSTLVLSHFLQTMANDKFASFDWGTFDNYVHYGAPKPSQYALANITSNRIALIQSKNNDMFSDFQDLLRLKKELKVKPLLDYWIALNNWTHSDYLFNENTDKYLVSVIIDVLNS